MIRTLVATLALCSFALFAHAKEAKPERKKIEAVPAKEVWMQPDFTPLTDAEKALKDVPFAPGAPAVILLQARQQEETIAHIHRRAKVLTAAGVSELGEFEYSFLGGWKVRKVKARTILPDGTIVDAGEGVVKTRSEGSRKVETVNVVFPRVEVGAIVDLVLVFDQEGFYVQPWIINDDLPIVESRFTWLPPVGLAFQHAVIRMPAEQSDPASFSMFGQKGYCWRFHDVPALPDLPNSPPESDVASVLLLLTSAFSMDGYLLDLGSSWKAWIDDVQDRYEKWLKTKSAQAKELAATACAGKITAREKAEAIRRAIRDRVSHEYDDWYPNSKTVDEVLVTAAGGSADLVGLAVAMLRSQGVTCHPVVLRRSSSGAIPRAVPAPSLFDHSIVRVEDASGGFWFDVTSMVLAGEPDIESRGVLVAVLKKGQEEPTEIPGLSADQNVVTSSVDAKLTADGLLEATVTIDFIGVAATEWREALGGSTREQQTELLRDELLGFTPGASFTLLEIKGLEPGADMLEVRYSLSAPGHGTRAGKRLLVNALIVNRVDPADWAAETRAIPVHFGAPYAEDDTVHLSFPDGIVSGQLPDSLRYDAAAIGYYDLAYQPAADGRSVTVRRKLRVNLSTFQPDAYATLRKWQLDMAAADDRPITLSFP